MAAVVEGTAVVQTGLFDDIAPVAHELGAAIPTRLNIAGCTEVVIGGRDMRATRRPALSDVGRHFITTFFQQREEFPKLASVGRMHSDVEAIGPFAPSPLCCCHWHRRRGATNSRAAPQKSVPTRARPLPARQLKATASRAGERTMPCRVTSRRLNPRLLTSTLAATASDGTKPVAVSCRGITDYACGIQRDRCTILSTVALWSYGQRCSRVRLELSGLESLSALSGLGRADATTASIWAAYLLSSAAIEERWSF